MSYSNLYFNKNLHELTYEDIEIFFHQEHSENETLEFKSFNIHTSFDTQLDKSIIRTIDAFLNSTGGLIVWGAPAGVIPEGGKEKIFIGDLSPCNVLKEKDHLINIISSRISPLPMGVAVQVIRRNENYIYVFDIEESDFKPHQFNERYFIRLDGQSKPAPHYIVESLFKQVKFPDISGLIKFESASFDLNGHLSLVIVVFINNFSPFLNDENISFHLVAHPGSFPITGTGTFQSQSYDLIHFGKPIRSQFELIVYRDDYIKNGSKVKILLSFGGKLSPARMSSYTLNLEYYSQEMKNANHLISELTENILFSDHQRELGKGKDTFIKDILER